MHKFWSFLALTAALGIGVGVAIGGPPVASGPGHLDKHDLSNLAMNQEACLPCHSPHDSGASHYLWNHTTPVSSAFTLHDDATGLTDYSLMCLACHDGVTAVDAFNNSLAGSSGSVTMDDLNATMTIGTDLTTHHPVGVPYDSTWKPWSIATPVDLGGGQLGWQQPGGFTTLPMFGPDNKTECMSCHFPHTNHNGNYLRMSNTRSAMCVTCHPKTVNPALDPVTP